MAEVVGLALAITGTVDLCFKYGNILIEICASFKGAEDEVNERILRVRSNWRRTTLQLDFIKRIWGTLDEEHRDIQNQILHVLVGKLDSTVSKLEGLKKKRDDSRLKQQSDTDVRKWKYVLVKESLDKTIQDLESWQKIYDPSWFLILRISDSLIDQELNRKGSAVSSVPGIHDLRGAAKEQPQQMKSIFLSGDGLNYSTLCEVPFTSIKRVQRNNSDKWVLIDSVSCDPEVDIDIQTKDVRGLARKLSCTDSFDFGLLQCKGVIRVIDPVEKRLSSFDFIFQTPSGLTSEPQGLRSYLSSKPNHTLTDRFKLANQLAKSVSYVHTLGFVHKNIRPETILTFQDEKSNLGSIFLVGFEKVRMADGRTLMSGDSAWEKNLYRHPHRQGVFLEHSYTMQHDIYSLGVCLLEIGLWESFVAYDDQTSDPIPSETLGIDLDRIELIKPILLKEHLVGLSKLALPIRMGERYTEIVVNCLTCLDPDNFDFGDQSEFEDEDGILVGVRYIEKILLKLGEIFV